MEVCVHCSTPLPDGSHYCSQCGTPTSGGRTDAPTVTPQGREIYDRLTEATVGKYEVLRELGRGGMAVVFLAHQKSLDRLVAIKVLLPLLAYDPEIVERFMREAKTQGKLDHPNIIQVFEVYNESGLTFFSVPFISGMSLRTALRDDPRPGLNKIKRYLRQAADALAYAHRRGVVHRDVKPDNILIDSERGRVILTDFGIAKALAAETTLTTPGDLLGTPQYMSPEQGEGRHDLDGRADQYSLGLIGWEMLAGRRPFQADNLAELMYKHRFEEPEDIDSIRPDAPRNLRAAIKRAISKDRELRFPNMDEFAAAMDAPDHVVIEVPAKEEEKAVEGGEETTVRIPTPPSMRKTPTPPSGPTPSDEPWAASAPTPPEPAEPAASDQPATVRLAEVERRKGPHLGLLIGGIGAVIVIATVVLLAGPFSPFDGPEPTDPTAAQQAGPETGGEAVTPATEGPETAGGGEEPATGDELAAGGP
ncbi:MAG: protein kinase, partial [Gemmatimonadetes bacterium]|nr:protein kinase [Gemmatimonadota bacterium]NIR76035.1 protein kinase [Candidatus Kutchimonas denitrificans]NIS02227.1 protein kinase [Gemmatimonadota bacterium]NIV24682.1 protein kinase [Gemmatimonadota bacterium]NIW38014.1 protein kinase [Gemmatimonadota bacterium]